jgi:hypothetical protein
MTNGGVNDDRNCGKYMVRRVPRKASEHYIMKDKDGNDDQWCRRTVRRQASITIAHTHRPCITNGGNAG